MKQRVIPALLPSISSLITPDFSNGEGYCSLLGTKSKSNRESYPQFSLLPTSFIARSQERK